MNRLALLAAIAAQGLMAPADNNGGHIGGGTRVTAGGIILPGAFNAAEGSYDNLTGGPYPEQLRDDSNPYLTELSLELLANSDQFITPQIFPILPVPTQWGQIKTWDRGSLLRDEMRLHSYADRPVQAGYEPGVPVGWACEHWSLERPLAPSDRAAARDPLRPERDGVTYLTNQAALNTDRRFMKHFHPSSWGWNYKGVDKVTSGASDSPEFLQFDQAGSQGAIISIAGKINRMEEATGITPNVLVLGVDVFNFFRLQDPDVIDRIKYTQRGIATQDILAQMFDVDRIVVAKNIQNAAKEGQPASFQRLFPKRGMLLLHATNTPSLETPTAGYMTVWERLYEAFDGDKTQILNGMSIIRKGYSSRSGVRWLQVHTANGISVVAPDLGMFWEDAVSTSYN